MQSVNVLKHDTLEDKRKEFIQDIHQRIKNKWENISTDTGKYYVHKNERIVLLAKKE